jgi:hypothetical protein
MSHLYRMAKAYQGQLWQDAESTQQGNKTGPARPALAVQLLRRIRFRLDDWAWRLRQDTDVRRITPAVQDSNKP